VVIPGRSKLFAVGKTGLNSTDRAKLGSKHHILTDGQGIPLNALLTAANAHDVTQLIPRVDSLPTINGRPISKPTLLQADRGYDSDPHRQELLKRGIGSSNRPPWNSTWQ
jgi:IS5 family transposase